MGMQSKKELMFRVLVNKFHETSKDLFLRNMPKDEASQIMSLDVSSKDASLLMLQPESFLEKIHFSWLLPAFAKIPEKLKPSVLASLPDAHAKGFSKTLSIPIKKIDLTPPFKRFLINALYTQFEKKEILPLEFLSENPLFPLLNFSKQELVSFIDYLGLYDLAEELRHIVEKNLLQSIYSCMTPKKQQFLKNCFNQKEKIITPRLELQNWDRSCLSLEKLLHKRGMQRLAHALCGKHQDFVWHVIHTLDSGRGTLIVSHYKKEEIPNVTQAITQQVVNLINFLNKTSKK